MKRLFSLFLILCVLAGMGCVPAYADGPETSDGAGEAPVSAGAEETVLPGTEAVTGSASEAGEDIRPALDGGVTDTDEGRIIRKTTTYYHTTVVAEATATNSVTGETAVFPKLQSDELTGDIADESVAAVIADYEARIRAWAAELGTVQSIEIPGTYGEYYFDVHDEITQTDAPAGDVIFVGDLDDLDNAYAGGVITIETILDKHQIYELSGTVTFTPRTQDVYIDNTVDASRSTVLGQVVVMDSRTGESTTEEVYSRTASVTYSSPKTDEVLAMIEEAKSAAQNYADTNGFRIVADCVVTEGEPTIWDNRKYSTVEDGDSDYLTGAVGADAAYTRTHIASGDYGRATTYTVILEAEAGYYFLDGEHGVWTEGGAELSFRTNGDYSRFTGVKVDDAQLGAEDYTGASGSTVVSLKASYLATLAEGRHTLTVVYTDGEVSTDFTVRKKADASAAAESGTKSSPASGPAQDAKKPASAPRTGDESDIALWSLALSVSAFSLGLLLRKRKEN